jgi:hypothetical protein
MALLLEQHKMINWLQKKTPISDLQMIINQKEPGTNVEVSLLRDGEVVNLSTMVERATDFRIKYPSDWRTTKVDDYNVRFNSSYESTPGSFQESVGAK